MAASIKTRTAALYRVGFCVCLLLVLSGVLIFLGKSKPLDQSFYQNALASSTQEETVAVGNTSYTVVRGIVYKDKTEVLGKEALRPLWLAYEKTAARRSPLIALAGTDPVRFDSAILQLQTVQKSLALLQTDSKKNDDVLHALYPIAFLQAASNLERARLAFLDGGKDTDATVYEQAGFAAVKAYQTDLQKFKQSFIREVPKTAPPYVTVRTYNSYDTFLDTIDMLMNGMRATESTLHARQKCFAGNSSACTTNDIAFTDVTVAPATSQISPQTLTSVQSKLLLPPLKDLLVGRDPSEEPLLALASPRCTADIPGTSLFLLNRVPNNTGIQRVPLYAGNGRLVDITTQSNVPFFQFFIAHGLRYVPSSPLVYYECLEYPYDLAHLLALETARDAAKNYPLSSASTGSTRAKFTALEKLLQSSTPVTEHDANNYTSLALDAAKSGGLVSEAYAKALELALATHNNSAWYENQILNMSELERINVELYTKGIAVGLDATSLFYTRSGFASLFMAYNPSVAGTPAQLFGSTTIDSSKQPYIYYDSLSPQEKAQANRDKEFYYTTHHGTTSVQQ